MCLKTCNQLTISTFSYHAHQLICYTLAEISRVYSEATLKHQQKSPETNRLWNWFNTYRFLQLAFKISAKCLSLHLSIPSDLPSKSCTFVATSFIDRVGGLVPGAYIGVMVLIKFLTWVAIHAFGGWSWKQFSSVLTPWKLSSMLKFLHPALDFEVTEPQIHHWGQCGSYKIKMAKLLQRP
jgi:hypothetical protein